jgi:hypothetical protein
MAVVRHIIKVDGMLGLYAGMESTFWRYVLRPQPNRSCTDSDIIDTFGGVSYFI